MNDVVLDALHASLRGLSARQRITADNVANLETPGFLAGRVEFESSLRDALRTGATASVAPTTSRSDAPTGPNGNNVNLDEETISMIETGLRYQLTVEAVNAKLGLLRTAIRGS